MVCGVCVLLINGARGFLLPRVPRASPDQGRRRERVCQAQTHQSAIAVPSQKERPRAVSHRPQQRFPTSPNRESGQAPPRGFSASQLPYLRRLLRENHNPSRCPNLGRLKVKRALFQASATIRGGNPISRRGLRHLRARRGRKSQHRKARRNGSHRTKIPKRSLRTARSSHRTREGRKRLLGRNQRLRAQTLQHRIRECQGRQLEGRGGARLPPPHAIQCPRATIPHRLRARNGHYLRLPSRPHAFRVNEVGRNKRRNWPGLLVVLLFGQPIQLPLRAVG